MPEKTPQQHTRRRKRTAALALLFLAGGAVVNVAVAWACFFFVEFGEFERFADSDIRVQPGDWIYEVSPFAKTGASVTRQRAFGRELDRYYSFEQTLQATDVGWLLAERIAIGFPLKAIEGANVLMPIEDAETSSEPSRTLVMQGAIPILGTIVPIHPRHPGFIINTLFYAMLLWLLVATPFAARRTLRRRRGLCAKCAYPVGTSPVCTECGAAVASRPIGTDRLQS